MVGVAKTNSTVDVGKLDYAIRETLNPVAPRVMGVVKPLRVVLTDRPEGSVEMLEAPFFPDIEDSPTRTLALGREVWIESEDFAVEPPPGWKRLSPGGEVRLRHGYVIRCHEVVTDPETGEVTELRCTHDPSTLGRNPDRKIGGTIHWVSGTDGVPAEFRLYDRLFRAANPDDGPEDGDFTDNLNPGSLAMSRGFVEPSAARGAPGVPGLDAPVDAPWEARVQMERLGYFARDLDFAPDAPVFNRVVTLKDAWSRRTESATTERQARVAAPIVAVAPKVSESREAVRADDPELATRFRRYQAEMGVSDLDADVLTGSRALSDLFESTLAVHPDPADVTAWIVNEVARFVDQDSAPPFTGAQLGALFARVAEGAVTRRGAKEVLGEMASGGGDPDDIIRSRGLEAVSDRSSLEPVVEEVLREFAGKVEEYRAGSRNLFGLFMGQVMRRTGGSADPAVVKALLTARLEG
jgi:glutaminyl-tRNA synthetase